MLAEHDPLTLTLEQVAAEARTSRPLVNAYFGDRRGLLDALQTRVIRRLADWVDHGFKRARNSDEALRALVAATFSFVDQERDAWTFLTTSGGLDHPDLHAVRARWVEALGDEVPAQAVVAAVLFGSGGWVARGEAAESVAAVLSLLITGAAPADETWQD